MGVLLLRILTSEFCTGSLPSTLHFRTSLLAVARRLHPSRWLLPGPFHQRASLIICAHATTPWRVRARLCAFRSALNDRFPTRSSRAEQANREFRRSPAPDSLWILESRCRRKGGTLSLAAHQLLYHVSISPLATSSLRFRPLRSPASKWRLHL